MAALRKIRRIRGRVMESLPYCYILNGLLGRAARLGKKIKILRLSYFAKHSLPPGACAEMEYRAAGLANALADWSFVRGVFGRIERPVNQHRRAHDSVAIHESPVPTVPTAIAIIAHHKIFIGRHDDVVALDVVQNL